MSTFFHTKTLTEEIRRFRVVLDIWNEDGQRMGLFSLDMEGFTGQTGTRWEGKTASKCHSEGLQAAVYVLEHTLQRARDSLQAAKEYEHMTLSGKRKK